MERSNPVVSRHLRHNENEPKHTLSFVKGDVDDESEEKIYTLPTEKVKTEKSVRFAKEDDSLSDEEETVTDSLQTSKDIITWMPSEHLYTDDTFIPETVTGEKTSCQNQSSIPTEPSYGSSTFIELDTDDERKTESISSYTDSYASSDVFSSQDGSSLYKSWRDVTEIVKDIEDLEESEFVTRADSAHLSLDEGDDTEAEDSFEEQLARHEFIERSIHYLIEKRSQSSRRFSDDPHSSEAKDLTPKYKSHIGLSVTEKKQAAKFCNHIIKHISENKDNKKSGTNVHKDTNISPLYLEAQKRKNPVLESFGLNSSVVEKLKMENVHHALHKKIKELDAEIAKSENFIKDHQYVEEENARSQFLSQTCAHVLRENTDDRIQAHLIKMHPVKCFAEFVNDLPNYNSDFHDVLYHYKRQVENTAER